MVRLIKNVKIYLTAVRPKQFIIMEPIRTGWDRWEEEEESSIKCMTSII